MTSGCRGRQQLQLRQAYGPNKEEEKDPSQSEQLAEGTNSVRIIPNMPVRPCCGDGQPAVGAHDTPTVPNSRVSALLGLATTHESRMVPDTMTNIVYMVGPGTFGLMRRMPPGAQQFQRSLAPSRHWMLPCAMCPIQQRRTEHIRTGVGAT